ncbi:MAG: helix-turn-helix transcriptional regulator, partial [Bacteroidota bacterium]
EFYNLLQIGIPNGEDFAIMRIEDQPATKRMEMPLFRCQFYRIVLFSNAGVAFNLPDTQLQSQARSIYFSYPGKLESWITTESIEGYLICFTKSFLDPERHPFFSFEGRSLLQLLDDEMQAIYQLAVMMHQELNHKRQNFAEMIRLILRQCLISLDRIYHAQADTFSQDVKNSYRIYSAFEAALSQYFVDLAARNTSEQISVHAIAKELYLHPSYLNTVIKDLTGKTASQHLQEKSILEAKSYLLHTSLPINQVSDQLGFNNVTYFNRFFKKHTRITPTQFRKVNNL